MHIYSLALPYPPSLNRYLRHTTRGTYRSAEANAYRARVQAIAQLAGVRPLGGPVALEVILHPRLTAKGKASECRVDLDNCLKVAADALQGIAYADDRQITDIHLWIGQAIADGGLTVGVSNG